MGEKRRQLLQNPERPIQDISFMNLGYTTPHHKTISLPPAYQAPPSFVTSSPFLTGGPPSILHPPVISTNPIIHPTSGSFGSSFPSQATQSPWNPGLMAPVVQSRPELMPVSTVAPSAVITMPSSQFELSSNIEFSEEDIRAFQAPQFAFKCIPEHAPPPEWCK